MAVPSLAMDNTLGRNYIQDLPHDEFEWILVGDAFELASVDMFNLSLGSVLHMEIGDLSSFSITPSTTSADMEEVMNFTYSEGGEPADFSYAPEIVMFFLFPLEWYNDSLIVANYFEYLDDTGDILFDIGPGEIYNDMFIVEEAYDGGDYIHYQYLEYDIYTGILQTYENVWDYGNGSYSEAELTNIPVPVEEPIDEDPIALPPSDDSMFIMQYTQVLSCDRIEWVFRETFSGNATSSEMFGFGNNTVIRMDILKNITGIFLIPEEMYLNVTEFMRLSYQENGTGDFEDFSGYYTGMGIAIFLMPLSRIYVNGTVIWNVFKYNDGSHSDVLGIEQEGYIAGDLYIMNISQTIDGVASNITIKHDINTGELVEVRKYSEWADGSTAEGVLEHTSGCRITETPDSGINDTSSSTSTGTSTAIDQGWISISPVYVLGIVVIPVVRLVQRRKN